MPEAPTTSPDDDDTVDIKRALMEPLTLENLRDMETDESKPFGKKIKCTDIITKEEKIYGTGAV